MQRGHVAEQHYSYGARTNPQGTSPHGRILSFDHVRFLVLAGPSADDVHALSRRETDLGANRQDRFQLSLLSFETDHINASPTFTEAQQVALERVSGTHRDYDMLRNFQDQIGLPWRISEHLILTNQDGAPKECIMLCWLTATKHS